MVANESLRKWLAHRNGAKQLDESFPQYNKKALELSSKGKEFVKTFGNKNIDAFTGFVDVVGFSDRVKGLQASGVANYLSPFLNGMVNLATKSDCLVDKTIGDEIMFVLPNQDDEGGAPGVLLMGQLMGGIYNFQKELGDDYKIQFGLSYGTLYIGEIKGAEYHEWTVFGEAVNFAKRLQGLKDIETSVGIGGAFGVLLSDQEATRRFDSILGIIAGVASKMDHRILESENTPILKGISDYRCALLYPKREQN